MNVLVIGGAGYIGSVLSPLLALEHEVAVYDLVPIPNVFCVIGDIRDKILLDFISGRDAVIYLAGITNNDDCEKDPVEHFRVNQHAFLPIVEAARISGIPRFIFASSVAAYGTSDDELTENDELLPTTLYAKSKAYCEAVMGDCGVRVRSASVCGPSPRMANHLTVNKMVHDGLTKGVITVNGGEQTRCHIHIRDICSFYKLMLELPIEKIHGQAFNVVSENQRVIDTANLVASIIGCRVEVGPPTDDRSYKVSGEKAKSIGFWPQWTVEDAVRGLKGYQMSDGEYDSRLYNDGSGVFVNGYGWVKGGG